MSKGKFFGSQFLIIAVLMSAVFFVVPIFAMADYSADAAALDTVAGTLSALGSNEGYTGSQLNALNQANAAIGAAAKNLRAKPADLAAAKKALENAKKILNAVTDWKSTSGQSAVNHAVDELQAEIDRLAAAIAAGSTGTTVGSGTSFPPLPTVPFGAKTSPLLGDGTNVLPPPSAPVAPTTNTNTTDHPLVTQPLQPPKLPTTIPPVSLPTKAPSPTPPSAPAQSNGQLFSGGSAQFNQGSLQQMSDVAHKMNQSVSAVPTFLSQMAGNPQINVEVTSDGVFTFTASFAGDTPVTVTWKTIDAKGATTASASGNVFSLNALGGIPPAVIATFIAGVPAVPTFTFPSAPATAPTQGGQAAPVAVPAPAEGFSEQAGDIVTPCVGGVTTDGKKCVNDAVVPPVTEPPTGSEPSMPSQSQSGPEIPTTPPGDTVVNATLEEAEDINFDLAFVPVDQSSPITVTPDKPPTPLITSPQSGTEFIEGNTIFDSTPSPSGIGDLSFSSFSVPAFVTSPLPQPLSGVTPAVKGPSAPIPPAQPGEQVNVITPAEPPTEHVSVTLDLEPTVIPMTKPADGSVVIDNGGLTFSNDIGAVSGFSWELPQIDFTQPSQPAKSNDLTIPAGSVQQPPISTQAGTVAGPITLKTEPVNVTLEIANQAAQAVQSGADTVNETINRILEFVNP